MHVAVEFLGISRILSRKREISVDLEKGQTFHDLVRKLGDLYPAMIGDVIQPDGQTLQHPNIFNLNAQRMIRADQMGNSLNEGDRIILMSMSAGG